MGTRHVLRRTLCPTLKSCKWGCLVFDRKRLEPRVLSWQWHNGYHFVFLVMYISVVKFEGNCSYISVFYCFSGTIYDGITFLICIIRKHKYCISKTKAFPKRKTPFFFILKSLSNKQQLSFYFIGT